MKNIAITVFIALVVLIMSLYLISFQVRETESALVTRFGQPVRTITEPKLCFKLPTPIERVHRFDSRMHVFEADTGETTTKGAVPIIVKTYVVWKIAEPLKFLNSVGTVKEAEVKLYSQITDTQNRVIGQHSFGEFVNSDSTKIKFKDIEGEMLADLEQTLSDEYGIAIKTLGIKQLKVNKVVTAKVFERMKAARSRRTIATISEGEGQATKIRGEANYKKSVLETTAEARALAIRGQGDAEAARHYEMLKEDPELAMFLRNIDSLEKMLKERSTIVIPADSEPFILLKEIPSLKPKL
ncbi:MAG: protease modulator HflC [Planctomycetes bacterium]|nr:protease modulator HflC [Planctomycetota bacterium]